MLLSKLPYLGARWPDLPSARNGRLATLAAPSAKVRKVRLHAVRELACPFPSEGADPQAGRYPGGYPFWPAGARRRAVVGVASERLHQERGRPSADR